MKITVVGTGYVGLVTGACLAEVGHEVTCVDVDENKIRKLQDGISPIYEPGLEQLVKRNISHERIRFTTDLTAALEDATIAFIAVGTPEGEDGSADLIYVKKVAEQIGQKAVSDLFVIVKSTVPVGTCDLVESIIHQELRHRDQGLVLEVISNPEFLKEGDAINDFMKPERIVVGAESPRALSAMRKLYKPFIFDNPGRLLEMSRRSSELTKYGANTMLATRISFMNELAQLCDAIGADIDEVRQGIGSDSRIGRKFLYAGPGYGGSCFPKDVEALIKTGENTGVDLKVAQAVSQANADQRKYVASKIRKTMGDLTGKRFAVWGLSFKPGTDDVRESPAEVVLQMILNEGAVVIAHDPEAIENFQKLLPEQERITYVGEAYHALEQADALILFTEWSEYKRPNWNKVGELMRGKWIFDLRNQYEPNELQESGFSYTAIGRPHQPQLN